ncbi:hypothetical protein HNY73_009490 [Argiope bruennichi]|uniref:Uncharacterized protein n=1 Tax=Argiope bruennichi TaxID=94029 RepID=A0A8T0F9P1_ARGBR|nr:hypothetical protein HNY73_009490 [Argiope bruennichi]
MITSVRCEDIRVQYQQPLDRISGSDYSPSSAIAACRSSYKLRNGVVSREHNYVKDNILTMTEPFSIQLKFYPFLCAKPLQEATIV